MWKYKELEMDIEIIATLKDITMTSPTTYKVTVNYQVPQTGWTLDDVFEAHMDRYACYDDFLQEIANKKQSILNSYQVLMQATSQIGQEI